MMTTASVARPGAAPQIGGAYDRLFYSGMAVALALTVFAGFAKTFYLRSLFGSPVTATGATFLTPLTQLHGALFSTWVLLFIVQTTLIANHRVALHRRMGIAGGVVAAAMVIVGTATAIKAAARGAAPPGIDRSAFLAIPLGDMAVFSILVVAALRLRRNKEAHKRLMLLAYISIVVAAVARLPGVLPLGPLGFFGFTFIFLVIALLYDLATRRRVHPAYLWGGGLLVASVPLRLMISGTGVWRKFAEFLING